MSAIGALAVKDSTPGFAAPKLQGSAAVLLHSWPWFLGQPYEEMDQVITKIPSNSNHKSMHFFENGEGSQG